MKVLLLGNYSLAKVVLRCLTAIGCEVLCICNRNVVDNKYGDGIQQYAEAEGIPTLLGHVGEHLHVISDFAPDFALSVAYKLVIPVEVLQFPCFGIHFGGLYGPNAIRGGNSSVWYRLRGDSEATVTLYRLMSTTIDTGHVLNECQFALGDIAEDILQEIIVIPDLVKTLVGSWPAIGKVMPKVPVEELGSYYPKAYARHYSPELYTPKEQNRLVRCRLSARSNDSSVIVQQVNLANIGCYTYGLSDRLEEDRGVIYFHGLGSSQPSPKLTVLADFLDGITVYAPTIETIGRQGCNGKQDISHVNKFLCTLLDIASENKYGIILSSISALLVSPLLRTYDTIKNIYLVTPIISLKDSYLDPALTPDAIRSSTNEVIEMQTARYKNLRMSRTFVEYLLGLDLYQEAPNFLKTGEIILAQDDDITNSEQVRRKLIHIGWPANAINVVEGEHAFSSLLQVYYLACTVLRRQRIAGSH